MKVAKISHSHKDARVQFTVVDWIENQCNKTPSAVALVFKETAITYGELQSRTDSLASFLIAKGIGRGAVVGLCLERGIEMYIALLGVMKAGAAYLPVDTKNPKARVDFVFKDADVSLVITHKRFQAHSTSDQPWQACCIEEIEQVSNLAYPTNVVNRFPKIDDLAYVIYTSGSTGKPKGVMVAHASLSNLQAAIIEKIKADERTSFLSLASYSFDMSCLELYLPLIVGGRLILAEAGLGSDGYVLQAAIQKYMPTHMQATPSTWQILLDSGWANTEKVIIFTGGERTSEALKNQLVGLSEMPVYNMYGPTETTVWSAMCTLTKAEKVSIGWPIANTELFIIGENRELIEDDRIGELCIAGAGLALGYINRSELTAEKFVMGINEKLDKVKVYRTGDLARWLPDGTIELLGRSDEQVKIRGYRIELGEIEETLRSLPAVKDVVIIAPELSDGARSLVAFIVPGYEYDKAALLAAVATMLPDYMVPSFVVELDKLPLSANGKVDRKALPLTAIFSNGVPHSAPQTPVQELLVNIWGDHLPTTNIGIHDHFFKMGGQSLSATRVISAIRKALSVDLTIKDFFNYPTVAALASHIEQLDKKESAAVVVAQRPVDIPLSFAQSRLWVIHQLEGSFNYHVPHVFRILGKIDQAALAHAFKLAIQRHEPLRTVFREVGGVPSQYVLDESGWELDMVQPPSTVDEDGLTDFVNEYIARPFNLGTDYMLRANLFEVGPNEHILILVFHHIAIDGWSIPIFYRTLEFYYDAQKHHLSNALPPLPLQYVDFSIWQRTHLSGEVLAQKMRYWEGQLKNLSVIKLPEDFQRPAKLSRKGHTLYFDLGKEISDELLAYSRAQDVTLFMTMLAVFKVLLYKYTGKTDIHVGTGIANRTQLETEELIGFFVNAVVIRSALDEYLSFDELVKQIKQTTLDAYENQDVPFEKVVERIEQNRDLSKDPLFQILFVVQNTPGSKALKLDGLQAQAITPANLTSKFDLFFDIHESEAGLLLAIEYSTDLFAESTIIRLQTHYRTLLTQAIRQSGESIAQIAMVDQMATDMVVHGFNNTAHPYPAEKSVKQLFEECVLQYPHHIALSFEDAHYSYEVLNKRANQWAHVLLQKEFGIGSNIGICIDRSPEFIVAVIAVLKIGATYVPIDPSYPDERIAFMVEDTAMQVVLSEKDHAHLFYKKAVPCLLVADFYDIDGSIPVENPTGTVLPDTPAYIMYTSGSTGKPKGVLVHQQPIVRLIFNRVFDFLGTSTVTYQYAPATFDASTFEIWSALLTGGRLAISTPEQKSLEALGNDFANQSVNTLWLSAGLFHTAVDTCPEIFTGIKYLLAGGDSIDPFKVKKLLTKFPDMVFFNGYGPTECTTFTCIHRIDAAEHVLLHKNCIGKPIDNTQVYILDKKGNLLPVGATGELHIGGDGLALGYLNQPQLSSQRFITNPLDNPLSPRLYKTGDIARWLPDGTIEYLGRQDEQIKLRGYRIELGEIEAVLNQIEAVAANAVVVKVNEQQEKQLLGYFVPDWFYLKNKEAVLYEEHIKNWTHIYQKEYAEGSEFDVDFNTAGWINSFTGTAIPESHMREWLQDIGDFILRCKPQSVLEIGCGTGLIYYKIAPHIERYIGTDLSAVSIKQLEDYVRENIADFPDTKFMVGAALETPIAETDKVDTIIINSVVQYFPGPKYLEDVLLLCIDQLKENGKIILGDVRDNRLQAGFKGRLLTQSLPRTYSFDSFLWNLEQDIIRDNELCIAPDFFLAFQKRNPAITHVELELKQGVCENEMMLYRYNVILHVHAPTLPIKTPNWVDWHQGEALQLMEEAMQNGISELAISHFPNPRLYKEYCITNSVKENRLTTLEEVIRLTELENNMFKDAQAFLTKLGEKGYHTRYLMGSDPFAMQVIAEKAPLNDCIKNVGFEETHDFLETTNYPLFETASALLQKQIKQTLNDRLPAYMVPERFVALRKLPLTANGKTDRAYLRLLKLKTNTTGKDGTPENELQKVLITIWEELLMTDKIGIYDNFFELGGHSLLATRVVSAIQKQMDIALPIKAMFEFKTIKLLSEYIELLGAVSSSAQMENIEYVEL